MPNTHPRWRGYSDDQIRAEMMKVTQARLAKKRLADLAREVDALAEQADLLTAEQRAQLVALGNRSGE